jgi:AcrR family transcriptional regulator
LAAEALETGKFKRGPGGRPTREEAERRHRDLLTTTRRLLLARGWDAISIDEISRQSGVAKRFIYARYADKAALFFASILHYRKDQIDTCPFPAALPEDVEDGLILFGQSLLDIALRDESLAIARLFLAEASRFRDHARMLIESGANSPLETIAAVLMRYADRGVLEIRDPRLAAEHFFILIVGVPQRRALLLGRESSEREADRLREAVKLFLDGSRRQHNRS